MVGVSTYIEDDLVLEEVRVLLDSVSVRERSDGVLEHLLVDTKVSVRIRANKKREETRKSISF